MSTLLRSLCPKCGSKMVIVKGLGGYFLSCTACTLEYGRNYYDTRQELVEAWENASKTKKTLGRTKPKAVVKIDKDGNVLEKYSSMSEAARESHMSKTSIENRANRRVKHEFLVCDFTFRFEGDTDI